MSKRIFLWYNLIILIAKCAAFPVNNDDRIVFFEEEDERFNDIIDPVKLLKQKVDKSKYKSFVNETVVTISRFGDDDDTDDNADDFKSNFQDLKSSDELVESENKTKEFLVDYFVKRGLENGQYFQGEIKIFCKENNFKIFQKKSGDMIIARNQENFFFGSETTTEKIGLPSRTGIIDTNYRWRMRNGLVVIPYKFWSSSRFSESQYVRINPINSNNSLTFFSDKTKDDDTSSHE